MLRLPPRLDLGPWPPRLQTRLRCALTLQISFASSTHRAAVGLAAGRRVICSSAAVASREKQRLNPVRDGGRGGGGDAALEACERALEVPRFAQRSVWRPRYEVARFARAYWVEGGAGALAQCD